MTSVRLRVTLAAVIVGALGAALGSVLFVQGLHLNLEKSLTASAGQEAANITAQLKAGETPDQVVVSSKRDVILQVVGADGSLLATDHPKVQAPIRTTSGSWTGVTVTPLTDSYVVVAQHADTGELVVVGLSDEEVDRATTATAEMLAVTAPIGLLLLAGVVWLAIGRALRPVEVMRSDAATITSERLDRRLAVPPGKDEIPLLASTLNEMLDRISAAQRQQRQFISDASHELRTPLAIVRQVVELARRHPETTTVTELADSVAIEESRMEDLVTALLVLARLDDHAPIQVQPVDLDDIALHEVDRLRRAHTSVHFDRSRISAGQTLGDPVLLHQVVTNLLANAARHAASSVRVRVDETPAGTVELVVEDDGDGVLADDRERIFERFTRLDDARTRDTGGSGLGLAIVAQIVAALGGTVVVTDSELGGAAFTVTLPGLP